MSDELYIENFSRRDKATLSVLENEHLSVTQDKLNEIIEGDSTFQMITYLNRLERFVSENEQGGVDLRFLFTKLRDGIKNHASDKIISLLDELEELLDLSLR